VSLAFAKHTIPLTIAFTVDGNVPLCHPDRAAPQCPCPGDVLGIVVPPVLINRIHLPPILVLKNAPASQAPPMPDAATCRDGSFITVYDVHGGSPLAPPSPTS
jgi:hypothetical protein